MTAPAPQCQPKISEPSPHVPAAFINAIAEEGDKAEAVHYLQKTWNEACALKAQNASLKADLSDAEAQLDAFGKVSPQQYQKEAADLRVRIEELVSGLEKVRSYNVDIAAGRINYRPHDHIQVIDRTLTGGPGK